MAVVALFFLLPSLAMNSEAAVPTFDRTRTYTWYEATGGAASSWTLFSDGAYSLAERSVSAYSECISVGYGAKGWAKVWCAVECAESGTYSLRMTGHYRCIVSAAGGAEADVEFICQVINLDTGAVVKENMFAVARTAVLWAYLAEGDFDTSVSGWYGSAGTHYGLCLYVEAYTIGIIGSAIADAWGDEHAYFNSVSVSPYTEPIFGGCLLEGTMITRADGSTLPIERVKVGMDLIGYDFDTRSLVTETVTLVANTRVSTIVDINCGLIGATTTDHPMYVRNGTWEGWVANPEDLMIGMELFSPLNDSWVKVHTIGYLQGKFRVFEIQLTLPDNYVANGILCDMKPRK